MDNHNRSFLTTEIFKVPRYANIRRQSYHWFISIPPKNRTSRFLYSGGIEKTGGIKRVNERSK